jgi:hypothetical protein
MPRINKVKRARKAIPSAGIEVGQPYYWWKFRFGGKHVSKTYPKPSQLTQSEFLSTIYDINERIDNIDADNAAEEVPAIIDELDSLASEQEDKLSNMPDSLQQSPTGELLQNRADAVNDMKSELEDVDLDVFENEVEEPVEPDVEEPDEPDRADFEDDAEYDTALEAYNTAHEAWQQAADDYEEAKDAYDEWIENRDNALEEINAVTYGGE